MQRATRNPKEVTRPQLGKRGPLKIVLVYDGFADLIRAYEIWSALAAQFDKEPPLTANATRLCDFLRRLAKQTGMDFFCNTDEGQKRSEALAGA